VRDDAYRPLFVEVTVPVTAPTLRPVRWWRDDHDRYVSRFDRRRFNLSEIKRGDCPTLDAFVDNWRDTIGFVNPMWSLSPLPQFSTKAVKP